MRHSQWRVVSLLGVAQTIAWAATYYLPAVIGPPLSAEIGIAPTLFYGIVTGGLVVSALLGPFVGGLADRIGGRVVLLLSTAPCVLGLTALAFAEGPVTLMAAWLVLSVGMALGLYDASVATLSGIYGAQARSPIATYTLVAGLSSSVGWLVTHWSVTTFGWRLTCLHWASAIYLIAAPLYLSLPAPKIRHRKAPSAQSGSAPEPPPPMTAMLLALSFCCTGLVISGLAAHLPRLLELSGASSFDATALAALAGPAQVAARLTEVLLLGSLSTTIVAGTAMLLHPVGAIALLIGGFGLQALPVLHGLGAGLITTARATVPLSLFGPEGFGRRFGRLSRNIRLVTATGPVVFAYLIEQFGSRALLATTALSIVGAVALLSIATRARRWRVP